MAYVVNNTRGQIIAVVADGTINTSATSQTLVGKNVTPYGEFEVENLVHQLENFANATPPGNPIEGQIWYNTTEEQAYAYSGEEWKPMSGLTVSTSVPALDPKQGALWYNPNNSQIEVYTGSTWVPVSKVTVATVPPSRRVSGELYFNTNTKQLYAADGALWNLIGPEASAGFATTRWTSTTILDTGLVAHPVILGQVNGTVIAIVSNDSFTIKPSDRPSGFVSLVAGINMSTTAILNGTVSAANSLATPRTINGVAFDGTANVIVPTNGALTAGGYLVGTEFSGTVPQTWTVNASAANAINSIVARDNLGDFAARVITANLVGTVTGTATNVSGLVTPTHGGTGQSTYIAGEVLVGKSDGGLNKGRVIGGTFITIQDGDGNITVNYTGGTGDGTVASVGINTIGDGIGISGSPITNAGNITITNTGVVRITAGTGIAASPVNGNVVVTNTGVTRLVAGTNISLTPTNGNGVVTINATPVISGVAKVKAGVGMSVTPGSGTGEVTVNNAGVTRLRAGSNISLTAESGDITISATTSGGSAGVSRILPGTGITISPIGGQGDVTVATTGMMTTNTQQTVSGLKEYTNGIVSQAYNFTLTGNSIFWADPTYPGFQENVVQIAVDNQFAHQFYRKRLVVEGSADGEPGSNRPAGGVIIGIDTGNIGGSGVMGVHTRGVPGLGVGVTGTATSASYTGSVLQTGAWRNKGPQYLHIRCYSDADGTPDPVFTVNGQGDITYDGNVTTPASDYAEYFEWADGNPYADDRVGRSVTLVGNQIALAQSGDIVLGIVSAVPAIIGDGAELKWKDMYLTDEWGRTVTESYHVYVWTDEKGNEQTQPSFKDQTGVPGNAQRIDVDPAGNPFVRPVLNPAYNPAAKYVPRSKRQEWSPIGLLGKLRMHKGEPVGANWIKLRDINDHIEEWLVK